MYEIQKASLLKRISAFLLDFILMTILVTGLAFLLVVVTGYQSHADVVTEKESYYEEKYDVKFDISYEDYSKLSEAEKKYIDDAYAEFMTDDAVTVAIDVMLNLILITSTLSLLFAFLILEFAVPLIIGNGQTVGKKIFGIGVVFENSVRITGIALFTRTVLGKYTVETMIPIMMIVTMLFAKGFGWVGLLVLGLLLLLQLFAFFKGGMFTPLHDVLGHTVCVDMATQMVFQNFDELVAYKAARHAEMVDKAEY